MKQKYLLVTYFCLLIFVVNAQSVYDKEISATIDNDSFLLTNADAYYTNGIFLKFTKAVDGNSKKTLRTMELGQMIYTPLIRVTKDAKDIDRPYCGYLFAKLGQTSFSQSGGIWQYSVAVSSLGKYSFGEDVQNWYHDIFDYAKFTGWKHQIESPIGLDFAASYAYPVFEVPSFIKLTPIIEAQLGSTITNAKLGVYTCLGNFAQNENSALWGAKVDKQKMKTKTELFLYWHPQLIFQGYNATIEGGLFKKNDPDSVLGTTKKLMAEQIIGICYASGIFTSKIFITYQTKEAEAQTNNQKYLSVQIAFRMH